MPAPDDVVQVVREWVAKAENDLLAGSTALRIRGGCPTDTVCFHAQQAVEKYMKALLVLHGVAFPRTHQLGMIARLFPERVRLTLTAEEQEGLTDYATGVRYPGWPDIPISEARRAMALARRVRREVRKLLPAAALRPKVG